MKPLVNALVQEGEYWTVVFDGRLSRVRDAKGLHYLDHLLRHPGEQFHALALIAAVDPPPATQGRGGDVGRELSVGGDLGDAGPVIDAKAVAAYRQRFRELQEDLTDAEAASDESWLARAQDELDALTEQLARGLGLGGRHRHAGSTAERARVAVTKAIRSVQRKLTQADPALGRHLEQTLRTGTFCVYALDPALEVTWRDDAREALPVERPAADGTMLLASAQSALAEGDLPTALAHLREAVASGPNPLAHQLLGGLLFFDDDLVGARREWEIAFRQWKDAGETRRAALVAADLADLHTSGLGNRVVGQGWISRARRLLTPGGRCCEHGYVDLALIACDVEAQWLEQAAGGALELAREFCDTELEVLALADMGYALVVQGRLAEGFATLDEAMVALCAGEVRNFSVIGKSYCALLSACDRTGDVARAEEWIRVVTETLTGPFGGRPRASHSHCRLAYGSVLCSAGRWHEGEEALTEVLGPTGSSYLSHRAEAAARLASLRLLQGRVEDAAELLRPVEDRPSSCEPLARVHLVAGDFDLADAVSRRGLAAAGSDRLRAGALRSVLVEVELTRNNVAAATVHADALEELAEVAESPLLRAEAALARGRVAGARLGPEAAVASFEEARSQLDPDERPLLAAMAALELADALACLGDRGAAVDQARTALAVFRRLGAPPLADRTEALLRSLGGRTPSLGGSDGLGSRASALSAGPATDSAGRLA